MGGGWGCNVGFGGAGVSATGVGISGEFNGRIRTVTGRGITGIVDPAISGTGTREVARGLADEVI